MTNREIAEKIHAAATRFILADANTTFKIIEQQKPLPKYAIGKEGGGHLILMTNDLEDATERLEALNRGLEDFKAEEFLRLMNVVGTIIDNVEQT